MAQRHLDTRLLDKLLRGEATPSETRELVWHLLEACPDCARVAHVDLCLDPEPQVTRANVRSQGTSAQRAAAAEDVLDRVTARLQPTLEAMVRGRAEAPALLEELRRHPVERQRMLVRNNPRYRSLPLADLLIEVAWDQGLQEPVEAQGVLDLALAILDQVDPELVGDEILNDLRGRAWGYQANFLRMLSSIREAEEAFGRAEELLVRGTGDPLERARVVALKSTLRRVQKRQQEASSLLEEALAIYQALDEGHLAGRTMVSQALLLNEQGESGQAIDVLRKAQELIEPEREPYLVRVVQQNLAVYLTELGRYEEAMNLLPALRGRMVESGGGRMELLRLRWQEGKILLGLGHESRAEAAFLEVRKGFVELGIAHDAATVSLELASLYLRQGRTAEIRDLARQLMPIFQSRDLHQESIAALLLFQRAVEMDALTLRMVEEISEVVRKSRDKPLPRTEEPS